MAKILYLGLTPPDEKCIHYPVISVAPRSMEDACVKEALDDLPIYTHFIFTSKSAVSSFFALLDDKDQAGVVKKCFVAVGQATAQVLISQGVEFIYVARQEQAEGVVQILKQLDLSKSYLFWPHSSLSRSVISDYLKNSGIKYRETVIYDTLIQEPGIAKPSLDAIEEIVFTSPSTVEGFVRFFGAIPHEKKITAIGPITQQALSKVLDG